VFPVVLWLVGISAVLYSFTGAASRFSEPEIKSCVELYADVAAIAKDRPNFRLSAQNPDEVRCQINQAIFG
jgi:hypothetical protein